MYTELIPFVTPKHFHHVASILRSVFVSMGYLEVHPQNRLSILAACEDPFTIATFDYCGEVWPLPQTNQMWLEYELLTKRDLPGVFCLTTSYRKEPDPVTGRHHLAFPMIEFEGRGGFEKLLHMLDLMMSKLGIDVLESVMRWTYRDACKSLKCDKIGYNEEYKLSHSGLVSYLYDFPEHTNPFWNMKRERSKGALVAKKCDVLMGGMETIGSAERSCNATQMLNSFNTIEDGKYRDKLFELFGEKRVMEELHSFLSHNFTERFGGGIGVTRLIRALNLHSLLK